MRLWGVVPLLVFCVALQEADAGRSLLECQYFRLVSPSRDELAAFEQPEFSATAWIEQHVSGPQHAEPLRRGHMDLRRGQSSNSSGLRSNFVAFSLSGRRPCLRPTVEVNGTPPAELDGDFSFTTDETGIKVVLNGDPAVFQTAVRGHFSRRAPYVSNLGGFIADYRTLSLSDVAPKNSRSTFPGFALTPALRHEPDGKHRLWASASIAKRHSVGSGQSLPSAGQWPSKSDPIPSYRPTYPHGDTRFVRMLHNTALSRLTSTGYRQDSKWLPKKITAPS